VRVADAVANSSIFGIMLTYWWLFDCTFIDVIDDDWWLFMTIDSLNM
jgi:hypothetical protein